MLDFDMRTAFVVIFIIKLILYVLLLSRLGINKRPRYHRQFIIGQTFILIALALLALRGILPPFYSFFLGNFSLLLGLTLEILGMTNQRHPSKTFEKTCVAVNACGFATLYIHYETINMVAAYSSLWTMLVSAGAATVIITDRRKSSQGTVLGTLCGIMAIPLGIRAVLAFTSQTPGEFGALRAHGLNQILLLPYLVIMVVGTIGFLITEKEEEERRLAESETKYRTLVESSNELIVILQDGILSFANGKTRETLGIPEGELPKTEYMEYIHPEDRQKIAEEMAARSRGEKINEKTDFRIVVADGGSRWLSGSAMPITLNGLPALMAVMMDIDPRKKLEDEREGLISKLQQSIAENRMLTGLLPICASCKMIRDDKGCWNKLEAYLHTKGNIEFTHGICPECAKKLYPDI